MLKLFVTNAIFMQASSVTDNIVALWQKLQSTWCVQSERYKMDSVDDNNSIVIMSKCQSVHLMLY